MPLTKAEVLAREAGKNSEATNAEAERLGTAKPSNECQHPVQSSSRAVLYKGPKPLQVTYCEACGAMGPASGVPTLGAWVSPLTFKR